MLIKTIVFFALKTSLFTKLFFLNFIKKLYKFILLKILFLTKNYEN